MSLVVLLNNNRSGLFKGKKVIRLPNQPPTSLSKFWWQLGTTTPFFCTPMYFFRLPSISSFLPRPFTFPRLQMAAETVRFPPEGCWTNHLLLWSKRTANQLPYGNPAQKVRCHHSELFRGHGQCIIITSWKCRSSEVFHQILSESEEGSWHPTERSDVTQGKTQHQVKHHFLLQSFFVFPKAFCWCSLLAKSDFGLDNALFCRNQNFYV